MLYNNQKKKLCRHLLVGGILCAAGFGMYSCTDTYDLDTDQPSGLNSIYGYLSGNGNYKNYTQLIKDLGQDAILSKTGSRTLFVADDKAFAEFFKSNKWNVHSYDELTKNQKALLLKSSMVDNPLTTTLLSTAQGPVRGEVCRRNTSQTIYDSVHHVAVTDPILPQTENFKGIASRDSIVLFTDNSAAAPMVHFTAKFINSNKIQYSDIDFVLNDKEGHLAADEKEFLVVNNAHVTDIENDANIFCKNGFVHKVDRVIMPLDNMAEIIRKDPNTKIFSGILERYAALDVDASLTRSYYGDAYQDGDSVFIKRYFSLRSKGEDSRNAEEFNVDAFNNKAELGGLLKFDPGWNAYVPSAFNNREPMMEDLAVMMVPSDEAMTKWWNEGSGLDIKTFYGSFENTPLKTLTELVNVNMYESFNGTIPSRANTILDDDGSPIGINFAADVDSVTMGCNGLIYHTNKVFTPKSYASVLFPSVIDTLQFSAVGVALDQLDYKAYLNSMVSTYTFFLPTNNALLGYVDPVSFALTSAPQNLWSFTLDPETNNLYAKLYPCVLNADGVWEIAGDEIANANVGLDSSKKPQKVVANGGSINATGDRFEDILDNMIVIEPLVPGKKYYKTKGKNFIKVEGDITAAATNPGAIKVSGSGQDSWGSSVVPTQVYNKENGQTFVVDQMLLSTDRSVAKVLNDYADFSEFYKVMEYGGALTKANLKDSWLAGDQQYGNVFNLKNYGSVGAEDIPSGLSTKSYKATYLLNNYHYTVYAPTNDAMEKAYTMGLPRPEAIDALEDELEILKDNETDAESKKAIEAKEKEIACLKEAMLDFVKYHIQDNSVYMDLGFNSGNYETAKTELIGSTNIIERGDDEDKPAYYEEDFVGLDKTNWTADSIRIYSDVARTTYKSYKVDKLDMQGDVIRSVIYYNGMYTPGRPYKLAVNVSSSSLSVKDNIGNVANVVPGLENIMAREYWLKLFSGTFKETMDDAYKMSIDNSSSVVVHGIDNPLVYDMEQFVYTYKKVDTSNSVKPRK